MPLPPNHVLSVHEYLDLINTILSEITVTVEGEITSLNRGPSGHVYFDLGEVKNNKKAIFSCALWKFKADSLNFDLKVGEQVQITGKANLYKPNGRYSFIVDKIAPTGEGALKKAFEKLKKELEAKGYFAPERKRQLPQFPEKIAVLTSKSGDALKDFRAHLGAFGIEVNFVDCRVEGINAINEIVNGIGFVNRRHPDVELIVVTRGGGSLESLQAYNSREVAEAIYSSRIPVLSAVGHENDITISDLVADVRASTPTDAGNVVCHGWREGKQTVELASQRLINTTENLIQQLQTKLTTSWQQNTHLVHLLIAEKQESLLDTTDALTTRFAARINELHTFLKTTTQQLTKDIRWHIQNYKNTERRFHSNTRTFALHLEERYESLQYFNSMHDLAFQRILTNHRKQLRASAQHLALSDPTLKLRQGYSIVRDHTNTIVRSVDVLQTGDALTVQLSDGTVDSTVQKTERTSHG